MRGYASDGDVSSDGDGEESLFDECDDVSLGNNSTRSLQIVRKDIQLMNVIRGIVILVILTMTVISADIVFVVTKEHEDRNFKVAFHEVSVLLNRQFYSRIENALWTAKSLAVGIGESHRGSRWPNATVSNFASLVEGPMHLTNASVVTFSPMLTAANRYAWESYAAKAIASQEIGLNHSDYKNVTYFVLQRLAQQGIYQFNNGIASDEEASTGPFLFPIWHMFPPPKRNTSDELVGILFNEASNPSRDIGLEQMMNRSGSSISSFLFNDTDASDLAIFHVPRAIIYYPVFDPSETPEPIIGSLGLQFKWEAMIQNAVTDHKEAIIVVIESSCGDMHSYKVEGINAKFLGPGDLHAKAIDGYEKLPSDYTVFSELFDPHGLLPLDSEASCLYKITAYPSKDFKQKFLTNRPDIYRGIVLSALFIIVVIFIVFDAYLDRHQNRVLAAAKQSDAIVRSLFPNGVTDRLYEEARKQEDEKARDWNETHSHFETPKSRVKKFMRQPDGITVGSMETDDTDQAMTDPIADLFPNTTVLFADLAGFTAWSSEREPAQVFVLLETIYRAMDKAAKRMNVFKVETIGDCYVAATGLPEPQEDHAERMAKFARKCLKSVAILTKRLEARLGPGTADLAMRIGIHSGPVTAGVLRGQKARFQLFGDTMNVASRIESTGEKNKIHLSKETARLLPQYMVTRREGVVILKGKGPQETFWLTLPSESSGSYASSMSDESGNISDSRVHVDGERIEGMCLEGILGKTKITSEMENLIDWNVDVLKPLLSAIVTHRSASRTKSAQKSEAFETEKVDLKVHMVIPLPQFDENVAFNKMRQSRQNVSEGVESELHEFVTALATCYPRNPFHSFEHCSHVVLSATKLLKRILAPDDIPQQHEEGLTVKVLHEHTFGIASDPICQFAVVFSALIHDVGHSGVSNQRLALERPELAEKYDHRSIAEQRSLDIAFALLHQPRFHKLRSCIYQNEAECIRFRNIVVNCVLATDIFEKEGSALRNARWDAAFHQKDKAPDHDLDMNRKATIVLDHIILASDVAHTMQHWHVYKKWNQRLFNEMYSAYLAGRSSFDPSSGWYEGELKFFDNYIIPLAHKLKECGVFGVNSDEYLDYACQNRLEWEQKGADLVQNMVESAAQRASKKQQRMETVLEENLDDSCSRLAAEVPLAPQGSGTAVEESVEVPSSPIAEVSRFCTPITKENVDDSISRRAELPSLVPQAPRGYRTVVAPQGKLNIILSAAEKGLIRVDNVSKESPLLGMLEVGEYVVSIDGTPTLNLAPFEVGELLNKNRERKFEVISDPFIARALAELHAANLAIGGSDTSDRVSM